MRTSWNGAQEWTRKQVKPTCTVIRNELESIAEIMQRMYDLPEEQRVTLRALLLKAFMLVRNQATQPLRDAWARDLACLEVHEFQALQDRREAGE